MSATVRCLIALGLLACVAPGCKKEDPSKAYKRLVFHAKMGNEEAFLDGFTKQSAHLIRGLLALRRTYGDLVSTDADPYMSLVLEKVEDVKIEEDVEVRAEDGVETMTTDVATLTVTDGNIQRKIVMIRFEEGWKIDILQLQEMWADDRKTFKNKM